MPTITQTTRRRRWLWSVGGVAAVLVIAGATLPASGGASRPITRLAPARSSVARAIEGIPAFAHVFLIIGENTSENQVTAKTAPFLTSSIKPQAAWLTNYFAVAERSLGNYVAIVSGQFNSCEAQNAFSFTNGDVPGQIACHQNVDNLFHQLDGARISWLDWHESAGNPCDMFDHGAIWARNGYVSHRNPALYLDDIQANHSSEDIVPSAECRAKVLPAGTTAPDDMSFFNAALAKGTVARFNLVVPNVCESGSDLCGGSSTVAQFDSFLSREIPKIKASPAFGANGTIIVTWDEGGDPQPRHIILVVLGAHVKPGVYGGGPFTHYSLLRTLEDGFGLTPHLANAAKAQPLNQIWK
jgi:hypothetical protein